MNNLNNIEQETIEKFKADISIYILDHFATDDDRKDNVISLINSNIDSEMRSFIENGNVFTRLHLGYIGSNRQGITIAYSAFIKDKTRRFFRKKAKSCGVFEISVNFEGETLIAAGRLTPSEIFDFKRYHRL
ncbi:hypothetical protein [Pseudomonas sp. HY7a-MNA-CIBAN-0227]|uniref:hypothetical protein n=1 Tax=Pseudomonas sp. HY7a-MNA-CIBAN-0227 TaxID=3140474 RepID=UPI00332D8F30